MRIVLDAMGSDTHPEPEIKAAWRLPISLERK
jgi:fatty acid/phospholipid biosynthesis enzyme